MVQHIYHITLCPFVEETAIAILALCPNYKFGEEQYNALKNLCDAIDYTKICNYSPMLLACGWWLLKEADSLN